MIQKVLKTENCGRGTPGIYENGRVSATLASGNYDSVETRTENVTQSSSSLNIGGTAGQCGIISFIAEVRGSKERVS